MLWHQGESDAGTEISTATYTSRLTTVVEASRQDAGWPIPWGVALVSFLPNNAPENMEAVRAGQRATIAAVSGVFEGPDTDALGIEYRHDNVHFNEAGLREHARGWGRAILKWLGYTPRPGNLWIVR